MALTHKYKESNWNGRTKGGCAAWEWVPPSSTHPVLFRDSSMGMMGNMAHGSGLAMHFCLWTWTYPETRGQSGSHWVHTNRTLPWLPCPGLGAFTQKQRLSTPFQRLDLLLPENAGSPAPADGRSCFAVNTFKG